MNNDIKRVQEYYDKDDEENRFRDPRKRIEFQNTCRLLEGYLSEGCCLLDCAAGTGAYEPFLIEQGCGRIVASDLSERHIALLRKKYGAASQVEIYQDNAADLSRHADNTFDVVLCLGPLYHLKPALGERCLSECLRVLKQGGVAVAAYMPRHFAMWNLLYNPVYPMPFQNVMFLAENGYLPQPYKGFWGCAYFSTPGEMEMMAVRAGGKVIRHQSVDLDLGNFFEKVSQCSQKELDILNGYLLAHAGDQYLLGASKHNLLIVEKSDSKA